jgi:hypothetical protein
MMKTVGLKDPPMPVLYWCGPYAGSKSCRKSRSPATAPKCMGDGALTGNMLRGAVAGGFVFLPTGSHFLRKFTVPMLLVVWKFFGLPKRDYGS